MTDQTKTSSPPDQIGEIERFVESTAGRFGWAVQPNARLRDRLVRSLAKNLERHGQLFCPCKSHVPIDISHDEICPCQEAAAEIAATGRCDCGLFIDAASIDAKRRPGLLATILCPG